MFSGEDCLTKNTDRCASLNPAWFNTVVGDAERWHYRERLSFFPARPTRRARRVVSLAEETHGPVFFIFTKKWSVHRARGEGHTFF